MAALRQVRSCLTRLELERAALIPHTVRLRHDVSHYRVGLDNAPQAGRD